MRRFRAELHIHTVLSPCGDIEMIPPLIVENAISKGIDMIAVTDHNATGNVSAVQKAAQGSGLHVFPGMELQTREEVHILCLFESIEVANIWQKVVDSSLPPIKNKPDFFGEQYVVDETGDFIRSETRLLATSSNLTLKEAGLKVSSLGGLYIPSHINRQAYGLIPVLGLVPKDVHFDALEVSRQISPQDVYKKIPQIIGYPFIMGGDAHYLDEILGVNEFYIERPSIDEIRMAFDHLGEREFQVIEQP